MDKTELIENWIKSSEENVNVANDMYRLKHYHWALFMWHLAIEKVIKALYIKQDLEVPYIHDINKLIKGLDISTAELNIGSNELNEIKSFNMEARYEDYKHVIYKKATNEYTKEWVKICQKLYIWIKQKQN